jgi:uncharacterized iron-regulated membrane protein
VKVKKLIGKIHLWLGLTCGLVVFVVSITGCLYAFQAEIQELTQPYRYSRQKTDLSYLLPVEEHRCKWSCLEKASFRLV